jgi:hypothetical protein
MENAVFDSDKFISIVQMHPALCDNSDADYADKILSFPTQIPHC